MGDARLTLEKQPRQQYDLLVVDAFSSDAIPVHLLTQEAFRVYFEHLKADGVLAVHVSNQYLDLVPVCARAAELLDRPAVVIDSAEDRELFAKPSNWVLVTSNRTLYQRTQFTGMVMRPAKVDSAFTTWTDQYSSLWPLVKL
jgi:spermidine synthase